MAKLRPEDLEKIAQRMKKVINLREGAGSAKVVVHMGTCGIAAGARAVMAALVSEIEKRNLDDVLLSISSCAGFCSKEPMVTVELAGKPPVKYAELNAEKAVEILEKHVVGGKIVTEYALAIGNERIM
jgi:NADP-reducing hydrogenase subunit HndB